MNKVGAVRFRRLLLGIVGLVVIGICIACLRHARSVSAANSMVHLRASNQTMVRFIQRHTETLVRRVATVASDPEMLAYVEAPGEEIPRVLETRLNQDAMETWRVVDRKGVSLVRARAEGSVLVDWDQLDAGEASVQFHRSADGRCQVTIAAPVMQGPRATGGVVLEVDLADTLAEMGFGQQPEGLAHSLISPTGEILVGASVDLQSTEMPSEVARTPVIAITSMTESLRRKSSGENVAGYLNGNGEVVLGVWSFLPDLNVGVAAEFPRRSALAGTRFLERSLAGLALAGLLGFGVWRHRRKKRIDRTSDDAESRSFGNYQLGEALGHGGMGVVYRARHLGLRRDVAVKVLERQSLSELAVARFEREVQLTAKLQHPNTIAVYDYGRSDDGGFFYAMELIDGLTLQELIDGFGAQSPERVIHLLLQICGSLAEAHGMGLIHRDIKPANILVSRGVGTGDLVKVLDFGLVKDIHDESDVVLTRNDSITGTPMYMSPEAVRDAAGTNTQSDLYSIAAVGYTLLVGRPMFEGDSSVEICMQQMRDQPALPEKLLGCPLPSDLQSAIMTGLRKDPADRWLSVEDFATALSRCADAGKWGLAESESWWSMAGRKEIPRNENPQLNTVAQKTLF